MKKSTMKFWKVFLFAILIVSLVFVVSQFKFLNSSLSGDSFYDEKCQDISLFYAKGYVNTVKDSQGCQVACVNSPGARAGVIYQKDYPGTSDWSSRCASSWAGSYASGSEGLYTVCSYPVKTCEGGMVRVLNTCSADAGDLLVAESFSGAKSITKSSLRYPIKSFCRAHPSIVTDGTQSISSTNIPQDLIDGKSVSISSSQTVTVFYYIDGSYNLPHLCSSADNLALDVTTNNTCKSTLGFTYLCSEGVFDAKSGSCVVQPGINQVCAKGRYDVASQQCIYNPPLQVSCPSGYTFDAQVDSCYRVAQSFDTCQLPYVLFSPLEADCKGVWEVCPQCPVDKICDKSICQPRCSVGVECRYSPPTVLECTSGVPSNGVCQVNGSTIYVCPSGSKWSADSEACIITPNTISACPDGSSVVNGQCVADATGYKVCPSSQVLNGGVCTDMVTLASAKPSLSTIFWIVVGAIVFITVLVVLLTKRKKK